MSTFPTILLSLTNIGILIFGINHIVYAKEMSVESSLNPCLRESVSSIQWIGVTSSVVAVIGIIGVYFKVKALHCIYLLALLITTISTVVFCVFVWAMLPGIPSAVAFVSTVEKGYWMTNYGTIFQKTVGNGKDWSVAKDCFREIDTCRTMLNQTEDQKLVYVDAGCCYPPNRCGLEQASMGRWVVPKHGLNSNDDECETWARLGQNCFDCESCKAGFLCNYQFQWEESTTSRIENIVTLIGISALAYYTFIQDYYYGGEDNKDPKHGKFVRAPV